MNIFKKKKLDPDEQIREWIRTLIDYKDHVRVIKCSDEVYRIVEIDNSIRLAQKGLEETILKKSEEG